MVRSIRLWCSDCDLPLTHYVDHGLNGMCVNSCFIFSDSEGSHGMGIGSAPALTTGWMTASETLEFFNLGNPSTCTHEFCVRTHDFGDSPARTHDFCVFSARTHDFCESPARTHDTFVNPSARTHDFCEFCESPAHTHGSIVPLTL